MADPTFWLARFTTVPAVADQLPEGVALVPPAADDGPPRRLIDPVPGGRSRVLGRWRLHSRDDLRREAVYVPDLA